MIGDTLPSPKNLPSWPISGVAGAQSAYRRTLAADASLAASPGWPPAPPRSRPSGFLAGKAGKITCDETRSGVASAAARWRLAAVAGGGFRAICVPRRPLAWRRPGAPFGLAPRRGLRSPSAAASPSPSLYLLDAYATRAYEDNAADRSVLALHRSGSPEGLAPPRTPHQGITGRQDAIAQNKREWRRRGGKAKAEATGRPMPDAARGEVRGRFRRPADRPRRAGRWRT